VGGVAAAAAASAAAAAAPQHGDLGGDDFEGDKAERDLMRMVEEVRACSSGWGWSCIGLESCTTGKWCQYGPDVHVVQV
jgi:hypothetical protein